MGIIRLLVKAFCRHPDLKVHAATGAMLVPNHPDEPPFREEPGVGRNVEVGVVVRCQRCDKYWVDNVRCAAGYPLRLLQGGLSRRDGAA